MGDDKEAYRKFVLADVVVKCLRIRLASCGWSGWFFLFRLGDGSVLLGLCLSGLIGRKPFDIDSVDAAPFLLFYQPLSAFIPRRSAFGIDVTESAVFRGELLRLYQQRRIA